MNIKCLIQQLVCSSRTIQMFSGTFNKTCFSA